MQNYLMEIIGRTGIFIICAQMLIHFRPKASYDKYLKMLVSAMILLQLFIPISGLFAGKGGETLDKRVAWFEAELAKGMEEAARQYENRLVELEIMENDDFLDKNVLDEENRRTGQREELGKVLVLPIPQIHIQIRTGGAADADISAGNP